MSWVKLDDQWMDHPKIIMAGRDARDMWLASITWCSKHLTDGYFPVDLLPSLAVAAGVDVANCQTFATRLLEVGLWDASGTDYTVHDYLDYNPSKEQALATREARKEAGRAGGVAKASKMPSKPLAKTYQNSTPSPYPSLKEKEEIVEGVNNNADKPAATAAPSQPPLSSGQIAFLKAFNAKRYKNNIQRDAVLRAEDKYGQECLNQFIDWAATKGMAMGQAIGAMEKTLPGWGKPKTAPSNGNGNGNGRSTPFERSKSVLTEFMDRANLEEIDNGNET
jgi:hypothetical protein